MNKEIAKKNKFSSIGKRFSLERLDHLFEERKVCALDIGAHSVKFVEVKRSKRGWVILRAAQRMIAAVNEGEEEQSREKQQEQAIRQMWSQERIRTKHVRLIISDPQVYMRHITVPQVSEEELSQAIRWQAEKYVPFPIEEAIVDFQIVRARSGINEQQMEVVLVAVQKTVVDRYMSILRAARLTPTSLAVSPFPLCHLLKHGSDQEQPPIIGMVDIGAQITAVAVYRGEETLLAKTLELGGERFTKAIAAARGIPSDEAEMLKVSFSSATGVPDDIAGHEVMKDLLKELGQQINRCLLYCERDQMQEKVSRIILCGGGAKWPLLAGELEGLLHIPVQTADPFSEGSLQKKNVHAAGSGEISAEFAPVLAEAVKKDVSVP